VLRALSLFYRVGYTSEVRGQLAAVCGLLNIDPKDFVGRCRRLQQRPGFVSIGPRYLSVRPMLFARPLFEEAWVDSIQDDLAAVLDALPGALRSSLLKQAGRHAPPAAREALANWGAQKTKAISPEDLYRAETFELLRSLIEVSPTQFGPLLAKLVEDGSPGTERASGGPFNGSTTQMHVVWCLRDLLGHRETYPHAERALWHLALSERAPATKARQSGTATEAWASSFRPLLSGTEVSLRLGFRH
jgi:hypothetical protein